MWRKSIQYFILFSRVVLTVFAVVINALLCFNNSMTRKPRNTCGENERRLESKPEKTTAK